MKTNPKSTQLHKIFVSRALQENKGCIRCGRNIIDSFYQKQNKQYVCRCLFNVNPLSSTPMHKSHIPLETWFDLIEYIINSDSGVNPKYIEEKYQLSETSTWNLLYKIKEWINAVEENENCINQSKFVKYEDKLKVKYLFKYSKGIPPAEMLTKLLNSLPSLFDHVREQKLAA